MYSMVGLLYIVGKMLASKVWEKPYFQRAWLITGML